MNVPIKRGTAYRLGLEPPRGPLIGVITMPDEQRLTPEEYQQIRDRFAKSVKGNWQFVYPVEVVEWRARRRWWPWKSLAARMEET